MRKAAVPLLLLLLATGLLASRDALAAAFYRNLGHLSLLAGPGPCVQSGLPVPVRDLEEAVRRQGNGAAAWRSLLRVKGWSDRQWIRDALGATPPGWVRPDALRRAAESLRPSSWSMQQPWKEERCRAAWDAWTLGLVRALDGRWTEAVAAYQAGLSLAPGRVPAEIVQEYYLALGRHSQAGPAAAPELATAKYLALGGEQAEAAEHFRALLAGGDLDAAHACQASRWLAWAEAGGPAPGPRTCGDLDLALAPDRAPGWVLPPDSSIAGRVLWGFDLDADVLEAGAEVLGTLYWLAPDGQVFLAEFRQPNLWPNSGNSWLRLEGFSTCLPGYAEPAWVAPCAGSVTDLLRGRQAPEKAGYIDVPPVAEAPDTYIATASIPTSSDRWLVCGGSWRSEGTFPRARLGRYTLAEGSPDTQYKTLLDLSDLAPGTWESRTNILAPSGQEGDFAGWIHPRFREGHGGFAFDNLYCFELEER